MEQDNNIIHEIPFGPSTIENIDFAFYEWLNNTMNLFSNSSEGWKKVPVTWISAERSHQLKSNQDIRDSSGMVKYPLITIERKSILKDPDRKGTVQANIRPINDEKGGTITLARIINQEKTANFLNADSKRSVTADQSDNRTKISLKQNPVRPLFDNRTSRYPSDKVVYQTITIPLPVYVIVSYDITLKTDYMQQLNEITIPFLTKNGNVRYIQLERNGHKYDAFIKGDFTFNDNSSNLNEERKTYSSTISIEVKGYLIGEENNQKGPKVVIRENAVEVKMPREKVIVGDIPDYLNSLKNKTNYRE